MTQLFTDLPTFYSGKSYWDDRQQLLSIDVSHFSGCPALVLLTGWRHGFQWYLWQDGQMETHDDPFELSLFPIEFFDHELLQAWRDSIPANVLTPLQCYGSNPLGMLSIISRDKAAYQLFIDHPMLFLLLYHQAYLHQHGIDWLLEHCRLKRTQIVKACGFPERPAAVKLLGKFAFSRFSQRYYELITKVFRLNYSVLNHRTIIDEGLLNCVLSYPVLLDSALLAHWQTKDTQMLRNTLDDIERMQRHRQFPPEQVLKPLLKCRCLADVVKLHDRLAGYVQSTRTIAEALPYPTSPLSGTTDIVPITDYAGLRAEGIQQRHCVESFHSEIVTGAYFVYQVWVPERATLGLKIHHDLSGRLNLSIDQLKGFQNQPVSSETTQAVLAWLNGKRH